MTIRRIIAALVFCVGVFQARLAPAQDAVTIFAAASLKNAMDRVVAAYSEESAGSPRVSYAGSSALARQIQNGAPAQIFVSANSKWMDVLEEDGLLEPGSRRDLLGNRLVLIAPAGSDDAPGLSDLAALLAALEGERLSVALVDAVPAGIYAREALQSLGYWDALRPYLAQSSNVRSALRLVALGEAPLGIVYATDALAEPRVKVVEEFDAGLHGPIVYPAAILATNPGQKTRDFFAFLTGPHAAELFRAEGFSVKGAQGD